MDHSLTQSCDMRILYVIRPGFPIDIDKLLKGDGGSEATYVQ